MSDTDVDPVTLQVIHGALLSAAREMGTTMVRTAYSVIFSEGYDFSCALLDARGYMVATANYCPVHLAAIAYASGWAITEVGIANLREGDVLIHNDPYRGGTHITDVTIIKPIFVDGALVAFAANRGHQLDMGGKSPGSFAGDATDIFQEGIRIPPIKWYEEGRERLDVLDFVLSNVRLPREQLGDFRAQLASSIAGERRVQTLCRRYGVDRVRAAMDAILDYSERRMREAIARVPDGKYEFSDWMDGDGIHDERVPFHVCVTIRNDEVVVDYSGSSVQVAGPINAAYGVCASSTYNGLLEVLDPTIPVNEGAFRPVTIVAPRGSVVNPGYPAPVQGGNTNTSILMVGLVVGALASAVPGQAIAASGGTCNDFTCGGVDPRTGQPFVFYWFPSTGWGGSSRADGWSAISDPVSNCSDTPIELMESLYPFVYERYELTADAEGPGQHRGGYGVTQEIRTLCDMTVSAIADRHVIAPYGLSGGRSARPNWFAVKRAGRGRWIGFDELAGARAPGKFANVPLKAGDVWVMATSGGGGYGDPFERDPDAVLRDVADGLISTTRAQAEYGVVLKGDGSKLVIDRVATEVARSERRQGEEGPQAAVLVQSWPRRYHEEDAAYTLVHRAVANVPRAFCAGQCPLRGEERQCPWHNRRMLEGWNIDLLATWTERHCPHPAGMLHGLGRQLDQS